MKEMLSESIKILSRTPDILTTTLNGLSDKSIYSDEGEDTWSPFDIVGHLIHGDKTDWLVRVKIILSESGDKKFKPFDRFAQFESSKGKSMEQLLSDFRSIRQKNLANLQELNITNRDMGKIGIHPVFGEVTMAQLISTWVVHDLNHIAQIARVLAKQNKENVGPWLEYLTILK